MRLQVLSDLHLEFRKTPYIITPVAPYLCLTGDICVCSDPDIAQYELLLRMNHMKFTKIFIVFGNHEYYSEGETMQGIRTRFSNMIKQFPNVIFLNCDSVEIIEGKTSYHVLGCTLWTPIKKPQYDLVKFGMSDYTSIYTSKDVFITPAFVASSHAKCMEWLSDTIKKIRRDVKKTNKIIVLTHHKPFQSSTFSLDDVSSVAYEASANELFPLVNAWFYGHTHVAKETTFGKTKVASNPVGYPYQRTGYNDKKVFSV